jgi:hypothetical protein
MYLGMVSISAAAALATGVYLNLVAATVLAVWLHFRFVLPEEEFLRERLGAEYLLYASRNPRWLGFCPSTRKDSACRGPRPGPRLAKAPAAAGRTA